MLAPELIDLSRAELYVIDGRLFRFTGGHSEDVTENMVIHDAIREALDADLPALERIERRHPEDPCAQNIEYAKCLFGDFDRRADIKDEKLIVLNAEFWPCPLRGTCPDEGIVCKLPSGPGGTLTPREIEVVKLIAEGLLDKEIADQLNIALSTAETHRRNIQHKLLAYTKSAVTRFAIEHNIIKND